jgi:cupin fold WbuC family metalloprotein
MDSSKPGKDSSPRASTRTATHTETMNLIGSALLDELTARAAASPRARAHHNIHAGAEDPVQRFIVVALANSYFRPHRHTTRSELAVLLRGRVDVLTFDDAGRVLARNAVGEGTASIAYETQQGSWHTLVPGAGGCAFLEIKQGPYDPATASEFAPWAPAEGMAAVAGYCAWLRAAQSGESAPA